MRISGVFHERLGFLGYLGYVVSISRANRVTLPSFHHRHIHRDYLRGISHALDGRPWSLRDILVLLMLFLDTRRAWCAFALAPRRLTIGSFFDLVFFVLVVVHAMVEHIGVVCRISQHLTPISKQNDAAIPTSKSKAPVARNIDIIIVRVLMVIWIARTRTSKFS